MNYWDYSDCKIHKRYFNFAENSSIVLILTFSIIRNEVNILEKSGFSEKLASMPNGIHTELTKEFDKDGVSLSGGEFQKIAIARAFMKKSDIIILDEPSSALDPMSEYELNQTMMSAAFDKTVIFISHRLSTTIMADRIYMLDNGHIIEQGNHTELMEQNGKYAEMFRMQAEKYQDDFLYKNGGDLT